MDGSCGHRNAETSRPAVACARHCIVIVDERENKKQNNSNDRTPLPTPHGTSPDRPTTSRTKHGGTIADEKKTKRADVQKSRTPGTQNPKVTIGTTVKVWYRVFDTTVSSSFSRGETSTSRPKPKN